MDCTRLTPAGGRWELTPSRRRRREAAMLGGAGCLGRQGSHPSSRQRACLSSHRPGRFAAPGAAAAAPRRPRASPSRLLSFRAGAAAGCAGPSSRRRGAGEGAPGRRRALPREAAGGRRAARSHGKAPRIASWGGAAATRATPPPPCCEVAAAAGSGSPGAAAAGPAG